MHSNTLISIIIPVYNTEKYLSRCIDSVLHQSFNNLEVILINDGSTDRCADICDSYAKQDSRIRVIHKENGGTVSARKAGIAIATGNFLAFVDSDDTIEYNMCKEMLAAAEQKNADVVYCSVNEINNGKTVVKSKLASDNPEELLRMTLRGDMPAWSCNKLFRADFWRRCDIQLLERVNMWEDFLTTIQYLTQSPRIAYVDIPLYNYYYLLNPNAITNTSSIYIKALPNINAAINYLKKKRLYDIYKEDFFKLLIKIKISLLKDHTDVIVGEWKDATRCLSYYPFSKPMNLLYWLFLNTGKMGIKAYVYWNGLKKK